MIQAKCLFRLFMSSCAFVVLSEATMLMSQEFPKEIARRKYELFVKERQHAGELPWFDPRGMGPLDGYSQQKLEEYLNKGWTNQLTIVRVAEELIAFSSKSVVVDFRSKDHLRHLRQLAGTFPALFDVGGLGFKYGDRSSEMTLILDAAGKLECLRSISFQDCYLSELQVHKLARLDRLVGLANPICKLEHFPILANLSELQSVTVQTQMTPDCFVTLSKLPKLKTIRILPGPFEKNGYLEPQGFNKPIRDSVRQAIASLDGRLQSFVSDEFTPIHPSIVRELCRITSLHTLVIGEPITGLRLADVKPLADHQGLGRQSSDKSVLVQGLDIHGDPNDPNLTPRELTQLQRFLSDQRRRINDTETPN